jgi:hypothetical protein
MRKLDRREFIGAGIAAAAAAAATGVEVGRRRGHAPAPPRSALTKLIDIGPDGVISPGSAQDLRFAANASYFADTGTPWIRMWADWPSLQPDGGFAPDDPRSPGYARLLALDAQIALACARGLKVMLMPYRFPEWVNGGLAGAVEDPRGRAVEYMLPADPYGPGSAWATFFRFLHARYHLGQRPSGRFVHGFEIVNEPNLQLWPQAGIEGTVAQLFKTAQEVSASFGHSTMLFGPSISDSDAPTSRRHTRHDDFVPALLDAFDAIGYRAHDRQAWSHHNYTDVEKRQTVTRSQLIRGLLGDRWTGYSNGRPPTVFVTEGGARLSRMPALYPGEEPRAAQAKCIRDAWTLHRDPAGAGAGVAMLAQYLLYADPNYDCGLLDPFPSRVKRPAYEAWRAFPVDA